MSDQPEIDDFFAELNAEIATHVKSAQLKADRDKARKKANNTGLTFEARSKAAAEFRELDQILQAAEWCSVSVVALFSEQTCDGCSSTHRVFVQFMECQQMIRKPTTQRWVRISRPTIGLPRETLIQPQTTHMCASCCDDHDFYLSEAKSLKRQSDPLVPSTTYIQEDINGEYPQDRPAAAA